MNGAIVLRNIKTMGSDLIGRAVQRRVFIRLLTGAVSQGSIMSLHRTTLVALATLFTVGATSVALADCCQWGTPAPVVYASSGCGGCAAAPVVYARPVQPVPVVASGCGGCGALAPVSYVEPVAPPAPIAVTAVGNGCGCGRSVVYAAPAIAPTPIAPAPIYVVNQGPEYSGPGIMVPYPTYSPAAAYAPYPYIPGYRPHPYYRARVAYHERAYMHPRYYAPMRHSRPYMHRPLGVRG